jgi:hypothetical protein
MRPTDSCTALLLTAALGERNPYPEFRECARVRIVVALSVTSTVAEAAAVLGVGKSSLKRWIQASPDLDPARRPPPCSGSANPR